MRAEAGNRGSYLAGIPASFLVPGAHHVLGQGPEPPPAALPVHNLHLHLQQRRGALFAAWGWGVGEQEHPGDLCRDSNADPQCRRS